MRRIVAIALILVSFGYADEPSAFKAGDLTSPYAYGLTPAEEQIVKNRKEIEQLKVEVAQAIQQGARLAEQSEGLKSVVEGLTETIGKIREESARFKDESNISVALDELNKTMVGRFEKLEEMMRAQQENLERVVVAMRELAAYLQSERNESNLSCESQIDALAMSIEELRVDRAQRDYKDMIAMRESFKKEALTSKDPATLFKEAKEAFNRGEIWVAAPAFEQLATRPEYKAEANFYLGETALAQEKYREALDAYKASIEANDKGEWVPKLLLHSAMSLEKLGDMKGARKLYETLSLRFPSTKEGRAAREALKRK
ncbi:MAG: hypothetical protein K6347_03390 [Campylobacterales bacterium]